MEALSRSPILEGSKYHAHSTGMTLSCRAYDLLLRLSPRPTGRDPIAVRDFVNMLEKKEEKNEDLAAFQKWMAELGVTPRSIPTGFITVCIPYLTGDCLPFREDKACKHAHPSFAPKCVPLGHPLVWEGGERVRLVKGRVLVAPIVGFDLSKADKGLGGLLLGEERDEGFRPCIRGATCPFQDRCIYHHTAEDKQAWQPRGQSRAEGPWRGRPVEGSPSPCFRGAHCTFRERCKFFHSEEDKQAWRQTRPR